MIGSLAAGGVPIPSAAGVECTTSNVVDTTLDASRPQACYARRGGASRDVNHVPSAASPPGASSRTRTHKTSNRQQSDKGAPRSGSKPALRDIARRRGRARANARSRAPLGAQIAIGPIAFRPRRSGAGAAHGTATRSGFSFRAHGRARRQRARHACMHARPPANMRALARPRCPGAGVDQGQAPRRRGGSGSGCGCAGERTSERPSTLGRAFDAPSPWGFQHAGLAVRACPPRPVRVLSLSRLPPGSSGVGAPWG